MFNNDFHWESETPSTPTRDAIDRINDRLKQSAKIIKYQNNEIKEFYANLLKREDLEISITLKNMITIEVMTAGISDSHAPCLSFRSK
ncbi:hypothetical protein [Helicobacter bilis]|uniref:hypothetical protein n=1 Tax=Helicobacter bilis TaxID=37372 RepID=UPI0026F2458F|nr:hypothetical protein [Helicobacter bilis]